MKVLIRTDASLQIGTGHVMRCLTLARELKVQGAQVTFASREHQGHLCDAVESQGFRVLRLSTMPHSFDEGRLKHSPWLGADWQTDATQLEAFLNQEGVEWDALVVDHYALDLQWESRLKPWFKRVLVIDDLADRQHDCDLLLDQNLYPDAPTRYEGLVPPHCEQLLGPRFAMLRPEFQEARGRVTPRTGHVRHLSVCFGGVDPTNETAKALRALQCLRSNALAIEVITGRHNPHLEELRVLVSEMPNATLVIEATDMANRFAQADLALGAAGSTSWERACLGLPTVMIAVALNQEPIGEGLATAGAATYLGPACRVSEEEIITELERLMAHPQAIQSMEDHASGLVDGNGTCRVASRLLEGLA